MAFPFQVANQFTVKYGKEYVEACRLDKLHKANEKVLLAPFTHQ